MKGKLLSFLILPLIMFAFFLVLFPAQGVSATSGDANIPICHHNNGVKGFVSNTVDVASILSPGHGDHAQDIIPPFVFNATSHLEHRHCVSFGWLGICLGWGDWSDGGKHGNAAAKLSQQERTAYTCPPPSTVNVSDATKCDFPAKGNQSILSNSCVVPVEGTCPSTCGYAGGTVPDGDGGLKTCLATNSCSTYRWCSPDETSVTGYRARAISVSLPTPDDGGKAWESGKMINQYCGYTPAGTCPTECGYEGGDEVADGNGGTLVCEPTNSCSTHRWCALQEDESYLAQAISDSEENPEGKPWVTGMDRYCEYAYEQCSITNPSYGTWGDWIVDNENESMLVGSRTVTYYDSVDTEAVCSTSVEKRGMERPLCQYDGATYADDPLCVPEEEGEVLGETDEDTDGEVLGVTDVVTADTAGGLNSSAYILQFVLVLITSVLFVSVGKEYLKK